MARVIKLAWSDIPFRDERTDIDFGDGLLDISEMFGIKDDTTFAAIKQLRAYPFWTLRFIVINSSG